MLKAKMRERQAQLRDEMPLGMSKKLQSLSTPPRLLILPPKQLGLQPGGRILAPILQDRTHVSSCTMPQLLGGMG